MEKFAHLVKTAEVRGVMAYLVDSELVKVASEEDFDALVNEVSDALGDQDYDLNTVLNKTAEVIDNNYEDKSMKKEAMLPIGAVVGGVRGANLSEKETEKLREHYRKSPDANLVLRNVGRGAIGGGGGGLVGGLVGSSLGGVRGASLGSAIGGLYGTKRMTDKYSKGSRAFENDEE